MGKSRLLSQVSSDYASDIFKQEVEALIEFDDLENEEVEKDENVLAVSKRLIDENREAYEVLAK